MTPHAAPRANAARRWPARVAIVIGVLLMHALAVQHIGQHLADWRAAADMPARIEVVYVREMALEVPPDTKPAAPGPAKRTAPADRVALAAVPATPASAPPLAPAEPEPSEDEPPQPTPTEPASAESASAESAPSEAAPPEATPPEVVPPGPMPGTVAQAEPPSEPASAAEPAPAASVPPEVAASVPEAAASGPSPAGFAWPRSTRLSYVLTGNFRGELHGTAQVEWIKAGARYQVHLDAVIGPTFAPLFTRRMSSEGRLTDEGLAPERFDQDSKMALRDRLRETLRFDGDAVRLANGQRRAGWPGAQDSASQFVQLAYLFNTKPALREPGSRIHLPLALPRHVLPWVYEVGGHETLSTPFGELDTFYVRPVSSMPPGNLSAEMWFAPALRYLPVRIRLRQDESTFIDLLISRKPELAAE